MRTTKLIALLVAFLLIMLLCISCNQDNISEQPNTNTVSTNDLSTNTEEYVWHSGFNDYEFRVLNYEPIWLCNNQLDFTADESFTSNLSQSIYKRNRFVEEKLNIKFTEIQHEFASWDERAAICNTVANSISSGYDEYDVAILPVAFHVSLLHSGALKELSQIESIQSEEAWWDRSISDSLKVNGKAYMLSSPFNLFTYELSWGLFFNRSMAKEQQMPDFYELVRNGKWTLEEFYNQVRVAPQLNGEVNYEWHDGSRVVYGVGGHTGAINVMFTSADNELISYSNGKYNIQLSNERMVNTYQWLNKIFDQANGSIRWRQSDDITLSGGYYNLFVNDQAMFVTSEMKGGNTFRNMESEYGILPMPKYDEDQKNHITAVYYSAGLITIPTTAKEDERVGTILDALSYVSYNDVLPMYMNNIMYRGQLNADDAEMFKIIMGTRKIEFGAYFGITTTYDEDVRAYIESNYSQTTEILSKKHISRVTQSLDKLLGVFKK